MNTPTQTTRIPTTNARPVNSVTSRRASLGQTDKPLSSDIDESVFESLGPDTAVVDMKPLEDLVPPDLPDDSDLDNLGVVSLDDLLSEPSDTTPTPPSSEQDATQVVGTEKEVTVAAATQHTSSKFVKSENGVQEVLAEDSSDTVVGLRETANSAQQAKVSMRIGKTINLGNFEFLKIESEVTVPCSSDAASIDAASQEAASLCVAFITREESVLSPDFEARISGGLKPSDLMNYEDGDSDLDNLEVAELSDLGDSD